jgi:hypothetical protein
MTVPLTLNELSLESEAPDAGVARARMAALIELLLSLARLGVREPLRTSWPLDGLMLAPDYPVSQWLNDRAVDREARGYWRSLISRAPRLRREDLHALDEEGWECRHEGRLALGLGAAYRLNGLAVSLASADGWATPWVPVTITRLLDDGNLDDTTHRVEHASTNEHLVVHQPWLQHSLRTVRDWNDLWTRRAELFPSLVFCQSVYDQTISLSPGSDAWHAIRKRLWELEEYFSSWTHGPFEPARLPCKTTQESQATLREHSKERTFLCPDGVHRVFSWHVRFTPGAGRIHFFPDFVSFTGIIGYIGEHLPTVKDPT